MKKFAFVVIPKTIEELRGILPAYKFVPRLLLGAFPKLIPEYKLIRIKVISLNKKENEGYIMVLPLIKRDIPGTEEDLIIDKVIAAKRLSVNLGVKIIGLNGYAASLSDAGYARLAKEVKLPLTSGNALCAWSVFEAIYRIAKSKKIDLKQASVAVIDADSSIGSLCSRKLAELCGKIILTGSHTDKLQHIKDKILSLHQVEVVIEEDRHRALKEANLVIKPDWPASIRVKEAGGDIAIFDAGLIKIPHPQNLGLDFKLPSGVVPAPLAEVMLLALGRRFINYSLGSDTNIDALEEIANLAAQHGFEIWVPQAPVI